MGRLLALAAALLTLGIGCLTQAQFFVPGPALWAPGGAPACSQKWSATQINSGLSGGGTTTVTQGGTAQDANVFASLSHTSGKYYAEFGFTGIALDSNTAFGIGNTSSAVTTGLYLGEGEDTLGFFVGGNLHLWSNNVNVLTYFSTQATTNRFAIALDLTDNLIWVQNITLATGWFGSSTSVVGDPVAGTNGFSLTQTGMTITAHPVTFADTMFTASSTGTGDFASTSWVGTAPSGYSAMCS